MPCLPSLLRGAGHAGQTVGEEVWKQAQRLWAAVKPRLDGAPSAAEAAEDVANAPEDPDAQAAFRLQLRKLLTQDPALLEELSQVWREIGDQAIPGGRRVVTVGGDVRSSAIIAGDSNTLINASRVTHMTKRRTAGTGGRIEALFRPLLTAVQAREPDPHVDPEEIEQVVRRLRDELALGAEANAIKVGRWLRSLAEIAPDVLEAAVTLLLDPALGATTEIREVAGRYRAQAQT